jgi:hypothetical protein
MFRRKTLPLSSGQKHVPPKFWHPTTILQNITIWLVTTRELLRFGVRTDMSRLFSLPKFQVFIS